MDGRDAFLTLAREKHYEFSSLRRAKFSTMAMLVELHNNGADRFVYSCNICKRHVETRYHCNECEVYRQSSFIVVLIQDLLPSHLGQSNFPITFFSWPSQRRLTIKLTCVCVRVSELEWIIFLETNLLILMYLPLYIRDSLFNLYLSTLLNLVSVCMRLQPIGIYERFKQVSELEEPVWISLWTFKSD